jgi:hypothetical protein
MCCFLSLGIWLVSASEIKPNESLFSSNSEESNFTNWLKRIYNEMEESDNMASGFNFGRIGAHSTKKGGTSYVSSIPGLCNIISVWLRAGWSLGTVLPAYIHAMDGGDQSVGRILSGLNATSPELSTLPPRFKSSDIESINWSEILVDFHKYPQDFKIVVPYLVASVLYHTDYIIRHLPSSHPIFNSRFWRNRTQIAFLQSQVLPPTRMTCAETGMQATGISPVTQLQYSFDVLKTDLIKIVTQEKESTQPITKEDFRTFRQQISQDISAALQSSTFLASTHQQQSALSTPTSNRSHLNSYGHWDWGGQLRRPIQQGEIFPSK